MVPGESVENHVAYGISTDNTGIAVNTPFLNVPRILCGVSGNRRFDDWPASAGNRSRNG